MKKFKESRDIIFGTPVALVLLSILIFMSKQAQTDNELWKAFILMATSNVIMIMYFLGFVIYWRAVKQYERQDKET